MSWYEREEIARQRVDQVSAGSLAMRRARHIEEARDSRVAASARAIPNSLNISARRFGVAFVAALLSVFRSL